MDYVKLIENGTYDRSLLNSEEESYIRGLEDVRDEILEQFLMYYKDGYGYIPGTLEKIRSEIAEDIIEQLKSYLSTQIAEATVMMIDNHPEGEGKGDA